MAWPPRVGELLPRADEAIGVRYKLATYSLDRDHPLGGPKARGFAVILGITASSIDYLEAQVCSGVLGAPIASVRPNPPYGVSCVVEFQLQGVGDYHRRVANLRTVWTLKNRNSRPRLANAYLRPRLGSKH